MTSRFYSSDKDFDSLCRVLVRDRGWSFSQSKRHGKLRSPGGSVLTVSISPGGGKRSFDNFRAQVRRIQQQEAACPG